jgi:hypothetical protein
VLSAFFAVKCGRSMTGFCASNDDRLSARESGAISERRRMRAAPRLLIPRRALSSCICLLVSLEYRFDLSGGDSVEAAAEGAELNEREIRVLSRDSSAA